MTIFNPNDHPSKIEQYLSHVLKTKVDVVRSILLPKSTRDAPWRIDVNVDGVARSFVLKLNLRSGEHEFDTLRAMESIPIPTPRAFGWDPEGQALGMPCFFVDFVQGNSLLEPLVAGEQWAEDLYLDTVCELQAITRDQLRNASLQLESGESAEDVLDNAHRFFRSQPGSLAAKAYRTLKTTIPTLPDLRFSNGDLWLENFIVRDRSLVGIIDFENAGFSDPIFEFLLSFFVEPKLQDRGIEKRFMVQAGFDVDLLHWYRGLEIFDTWHCVVKLGEPFVHHTAKSLEMDLRCWLDIGPNST